MPSVKIEAEEITSKTQLPTTPEKIGQSDTRTPPKTEGDTLNNDVRIQQKKEGAIPQTESPSIDDAQISCSNPSISSPTAKVCEINRSPVTFKSSTSELSTRKSSGFSPPQSKTRQVFDRLPRVSTSTTKSNLTSNTIQGDSRDVTPPMRKDKTHTTPSSHYTARRTTRNNSNPNSKSSQRIECWDTNSRSWETQQQSSRRSVRSSQRYKSQKLLQENDEHHHQNHLGKRQLHSSHSHSSNSSTSSHRLRHSRIEVEMEAGPASGEQEVKTVGSRSGSESGSGPRHGLLRDIDPPLGIAAELDLAANENEHGGEKEHQNQHGNEESPGQQVNDHVSLQEIDINLNRGVVDDDCDGDFGFNFESSPPRAAPDSSMKMNNSEGNNFLGDMQHTGEPNDSKIRSRSSDVGMNVNEDDIANMNKSHASSRMREDEEDQGQKHSSGILNSHRSQSHSSTSSRHQGHRSKGQKSQMGYNEYSAQYSEEKQKRQHFNNNHSYVNDRHDSPEDRENPVMRQEERSYMDHHEQQQRHHKSHGQQQQHLPPQHMEQHHPHHSYKSSPPYGSGPPSSSNMGYYHSQQRQQQSHDRNSGLPHHHHPSQHSRGGYSSYGRSRRDNMMQSQREHSDKWHAHSRQNQEQPRPHHHQMHHSNSSQMMGSHQRMDIIEEDDNIGNSNSNNSNKNSDCKPKNNNDNISSNNGNTIGMVRSPPIKKRRVSPMSGGSSGNGGGPLGSWDEMTSSRKPEDNMNNTMETEELAMQSNGVFRTPVGKPVMGRSVSNFETKRSPLFGRDETSSYPYQGGVSFGMDTPGTKLDDIFYNNSFEIVDQTPLPMSGIDGRNHGSMPGGSPTKFGSPDVFATKLNLSRSMSADEGMMIGPSSSMNRHSQYHPHYQGHMNSHASPRRVHQGHGMNKQIQGSPFSNFMGELSPLNHRGIQSSPPHSSHPGQRRPVYGNMRDHPSHSPRQHYHHRYSSMNPQQHLHHRNDSFPPFTDSPGSPPRQIRSTMNKVIQLPPLSSKNLYDNKSQSKQNDAIRASPMSSTSSGNASGGSVPRRRQPYTDQVASHPSPGAFRLQIGGVGGIKQTEARKGMDGINTVLKGRALPRRSMSVGPSPPGHMEGPPPPGSGMRQNLQTPIKVGAPRSVATPGYPGSSLSSSSSRYPNMPAPSPSGEKPSPAGSGKENESPKSQLRRSPCNCKKSKCLKLYCECFAAELYCDGCNCNDCSNTKDYEAIRSKAIKDTKAKNPNAFKPRISVKGNIVPTGSCASPTKGHNMGCRCKKSACLKKYCECFEAGVICSAKCKCVDCLNFVGSQALIDRRRKIKDHRGAEMAMRTADEFWKGGRIDPKSGMRTPVMPPHPGMFPSPAQHRMGQHPMAMHSMMSPPPNTSHGPPPRYMGPPPMIMGPMGYSPIGMQPATPAYSSNKDMLRRTSSIHPGRNAHHIQQSMYPRTPLLTTPRTPAARRRFTPQSIKKKRIGEQEQTKPYFGLENPEQTKTSALLVFSFLSNDDIYNASLVSHEWSKLSLDEELWQF